MYLVDTSVWVDYFRKKDNFSALHFQEIIEKNIPFGLCSVIYQEILQGTGSEYDFEKLTNYLDSQIFYHPQNAVITYRNAAKIYLKCRSQGITIRSTQDCLIAQLAIEHKLILLHNDKDFVRINKIFPDLKLFNYENTYNWDKVSSEISALE